MSLVTERWDRVGEGIDADEGLPFVLVARIKNDGQERVTIWKLIERPNGWYNLGQYISANLFRRYPEKKGVKLSDSRIDTILREYAMQGYTTVA